MPRSLIPNTIYGPEFTSSCLFKTTFKTDDLTYLLFIDSDRNYGITKLLVLIPRELPKLHKIFTADNSRFRTIMYYFCHEAINNLIPAETPPKSFPFLYARL